MRVFQSLFFVLMISLLTSCSNTPEPINWGKDMCAHCKMTIVDQKFGAEIFTKKGKTYKFDAAECMLAYVNKDYIKHEDIAQYLVVDASKPGTLTDAKTTTFLVSEKLPSPMGGNLSAYANTEIAQKQSAKYGGKIYDWEGISKAFQ